MTRWSWLVAAAIAGAIAFPLAVAACAGSAPAGGVAVPHLHWTRCPPAPKGMASTRPFRCATAVVPMNYSRPGGKTFRLALIKYPARDPSRRIGTLFWNPGGPSDAGTQYLPAAFRGFPQRVRERFDIVSWDPRGMGGRTRPLVQCFANAGQEERFFSHYTGPSIPASVLELRIFIRLLTARNQQCVRRNRELVKHVSTADNARNLDLLRRAVGDNKLSYYGTSYGTFLGGRSTRVGGHRARRANFDHRRANFDHVHPTALRRRQ